MKNFAALLEPSTVVGVDSRLTSGKEKLDSIIKIERATKTFIELDKVYRQAKIYGTEPNKKKARVKLTKLMAEMQSSENFIINQTVFLEGKKTKFEAYFSTSLDYVKSVDLWCYIIALE